MKLLEIKQTPAQLAAEYIKFMSQGKNSQEDFGAAFSEICHEAGNCSMVANHFDDWLNEKDISAKIIVGVGCKNPKWLEKAGVRHGDPDEDAHTVSMIGSTIVDFTARQFDSSLPFPRIIPYSTFKSEWKEVDKEPHEHPF